MSNTMPFARWPSLSAYGRNLSVKGGNLFYYDSGSAAASFPADGKPAVVLIHGLGDEADSWRHVFPALTGAGYRVIAPDLPGFGRSVWKGRISMRCQSEAVIRLITETRAADANHPAVIAGSSLGAGIAEVIAGKRPGLVKDLILIDGCFPFTGATGKGMYLLGLPFLGKRWYRGFRMNHEAAWRSLYLYYKDLDSMSSADRAFLRERVIDRVESPHQERGYFATLRSMNAFFLFNKRVEGRRIKAFQGNIAVIWGERDVVFPLKKADPFRQLRPDAVFSVIADAGHLPHQEKPDETAAIMLQFLGGR